MINRGIFFMICVDGTILLGIAIIAAFIIAWILY